MKIVNELDNCESNNSNEVISITEDESIVSDDFNSNYDYKDLYMSDVDTYYDASYTDAFLICSWQGYFEGKLVIYHDDSIIFSKNIGGYRIGGINMDDSWMLSDNAGKPVPVGWYTAKLFSKEGTVLKTSPIKISKAPTDLLVNSKTTKAGKKVTIKNIVMDDCGRADTAKGKITLKINGKTYSTNVKNGKFSISFKAPSKAKKYICKLIYRGDSNYKGSSYKFELKVKKSPASKKKTTKKVKTKKKKTIKKKKSSGKKFTLKLKAPEKTSGKTIRGNHIYAFYKYRNQGQYGRGVCIDSYGKGGPGTLKDIKLIKAKIYFKNDYNGKTIVKTKKFDRYGYARSNLISGYTPYKVIVFYK